MASNPVAANLLMLFFIIGGFVFAKDVKQEVFPEVDLDVITVTVAYPGASPAEVEEGVVLAVEEGIRGIDGVKEVRGLVYEGRTTVIAELFLGADADQALSDIKSAVDRIRSFPADAERPVVSIATNRAQVLNVLISGDLAVSQLRDLAENIRSDLLSDLDITLVTISGIPNAEISIEVSQENLRRYGLTLEQISQRVRAASIDLPGGSVRTSGGEVLVRTTERRNIGTEFENIVILGNRDGGELLLGDIATVRDGFSEANIEAGYEGKPAAKLNIFRVGDESPLQISREINAYLETKSRELPKAVTLSVVDDSSIIYRDRINLLLKNARLGVILVLIVLGIFLQPRLAFWVTLGMPISFLGAFLFIPSFDISINVISLFAFILCLGIVVDDAVVVGEAAFSQRGRFNDSLTSAIAGTREVIAPVTFGVLTTVIAFSPLLFVPGSMGKFFQFIPLIVIPILLISLVESLAILPAHLGHVRRIRDYQPSAITAPIYRWQKGFSLALENWIATRFRAAVTTVIEARYLSLAIALACLIIAFSIVASGRIPLVFFPRIEADRVAASIELPFGSPADETRRVIQEVEAAGRRAASSLAGTEEDAFVTGFYTQLGNHEPDGEAGISIGDRSGEGQLGLVTAYMVPGGERDIGAQQYADEWRREASQIAGIDRLTFEANAGFTSGGAKLSVRLSHRNTEILEQSARELADIIRSYAGTFDVDDGTELGKNQLDFELKPAARALGLTERDLAIQLRNAFFGSEAVRQQRGRDELRVYVRLPQDERESLYFLENLLVTTPLGGEIPLFQAAQAKEGYSFTRLRRRDGQRVIEVTSDVDESVGNSAQISAELFSAVLPELQQRFPGLTYFRAGEQEAQAESIDALTKGLTIALLAMFGMMAIAFKSYIQPIVVLAAVPFGFIGALIGHAVMGYEISMISLLGMVALTGVVINDSLVLISAINDRVRDGLPVMQSVIEGTCRRVRAVLLTSLTTFFGLAPIIFEQSLSARFLIPMAISLGFGVLFVTGIALMLVPCIYLVLHDARTAVLTRFRPDLLDGEAAAAGEAPARVDW
jgi:multidrug efflux pump subunit AcrB